MVLGNQEGVEVLVLKNPKCFFEVLSAVFELWCKNMT